MTLISNGPVPSSMVDVQEKSYKPESPPLNEADRNRFKESLDKAIAEETEVSSSNKKIPYKEEQAEVHNTASDSVKEKIAGNKKLFNRGNKRNHNSAVKLQPAENGKSDKEKLSTEIPLLKKITLKKADVKLSSLKAEDTAIAGDIMESILSDNESNGEELTLLKNSDTGIKTEMLEEEAVVIPFPKAAEDVVIADMAGSEHDVPVKSSPLKVSGKSRKKGKDEQTLTVIDVRSESKAKSLKGEFVRKAAAITENIDQTNKESNQIILGEQNNERMATEEVKSFQSRFSENKEVLLARELKESGNQQIIKKASFILKDNNQGEIKLILKPESLGRVKIQLNMNENHLVGKIIVENSRVGQIFENNLNDLSKSFEEAGISSSSIEVSVGDGNKQNADQDKSFQNDQPYYSGRLKTLDEAVPATGRYGSDDNYQLVNLVV